MKPNIDPAVVAADGRTYCHRGSWIGKAAHHAACQLGHDRIRNGLEFNYNGSRYRVTDENGKGLRSYIGYEEIRTATNWPPHIQRFGRFLRPAPVDPVMVRDYAAEAMGHTEPEEFCACCIATAPDFAEVETASPSREPASELGAIAAHFARYGFCDVPHTGRALSEIAGAALDYLRDDAAATKKRHQDQIKAADDRATMLEAEIVRLREQLVFCEVRTGAVELESQRAWVEVEDARNRNKELESRLSDISDIINHGQIIPF
jgi:hypothetical protein